jgi:hypothetical protein
VKGPTQPAIGRIPQAGSGQVGLEDGQLLAASADHGQGAYG